MTENKAKYIKLNGINGIKDFCSMSTYERCSMFHPSLKDIKGMDTFFDRCEHIRFEMYEVHNDTDGFETMENEGKLECMIVHRTVN